MREGERNLIGFDFCFISSLMAMVPSASVDHVAGTSMPVGSGGKVFNVESAQQQMLYVPPFKEKELKASLSKFLSAQYVSEAFNLPPTSSTIWNAMEEDMERIGNADPFISSEQVNSELLPFLLLFFSKAVVDLVEDNLQLLTQSFLGGEYALRQGKVVIAQKILDDIVRCHVLPTDGALRNFFGGCVEAKPDDGDVNPGGCADDDQWTVVSRHKQGHGKRDQPEKERGSSRSARGGAGGGRGGGRRNGGGNAGPLTAMISSRGVPFQNAMVIDVLLPYFKTPDKDDDKKVETVAQRSFAFKNHGNVDEGREVLYNPCDDEDKKVCLYHGTRTSMLESFRRHGIQPPFRRNEFSAKEAFYVSNSVQSAVEHPLHNHPGKESMVDPLAVLVFHVDIGILHGEKALPSGEKLKVYWFEGPSEEWLTFCIGNLRGELSPHEYDIVIGPCCMPLKIGGAKQLEVSLEDGVELTQISCCSKRAIDWMNNCVVKIYCEKRATQGV